jgi:hypothetical protein
VVIGRAIDSQCSGVMCDDCVTNQANCKPIVYRIGWLDPRFARRNAGIIRLMSAIWPYCKSIGILHCPADTFYGRGPNGPVPRRSVSMNNWVGGNGDSEVHPMRTDKEPDLHPALSGDEVYTPSPRRSEGWRGQLFARCSNRTTSKTPILTLNEQRNLLLSLLT